MTICCEPPTARSMLAPILGARLVAAAAMAHATARRAAADGSAQRAYASVGDDTAPAVRGAAFGVGCGAERP
jgi:hypothetical protein